MKNKNLKIILVSFVFLIVNIYVFFKMGNYVVQNQIFINQVMLYLTLILILCTVGLSIYAYNDLSELSTSHKMVAHILFWTHMVTVAIFIGTVWYTLS